LPVSPFSRYSCWEKRGMGKAFPSAVSDRAEERRGKGGKEKKGVTVLFLGRSPVFRKCEGGGGKGEGRKRSVLFRLSSLSLERWSKILPMSVDGTGRGGERGKKWKRA